jgi:hypothetical protein
VYTQLQKRLKRASEIRNFERVIDLGHEVFALWESTVRRAFEAGVIANSMGPKKTAAVIWATMNGAFMLMGDDNFFRDVTELNPEHFLEEALELHLAASQIGARRSSQSTKVGRIKKRSVSAVRTSRARNSKIQDSQEVSVSSPA